MNETLLNLAYAAISGGLAGTAITTFAQWYATKRESEIQHINDALRHVYGPVMFLLDECKTLQDIKHELDEESDRFLKQRFPDNALKTIDHQGEATVQTGNLYTQRVQDRIKKLLEITSNNWHLLDPGDMDVFREIRREYARIEIECESLSGRDIPLPVKFEMRPIHFFSEEWLNQIERSYQSKRRRYSALVGARKR